MVARKVRGPHQLPILVPLLVTFPAMTVETRIAQAHTVARAASFRAMIYPADAARLQASPRALEQLVSRERVIPNGTSVALGGASSKASLPRPAFPPPVAVRQVLFNADRLALIPWQ